MARAADPQLTAHGEATGRGHGPSRRQRAAHRAAWRPIVTPTPGNPTARWKTGIATAGGKAAPDAAIPVCHRRVRPRRGSYIAAVCEWGEKRTARRWQRDAVAVTTHRYHPTRSAPFAGGSRAAAQGCSGDPLVYPPDRCRLKNAAHTRVRK